MATLAGSSLTSLTGSPSSPIDVSDALTVSSAANRWLRVAIGSADNAIATVTGVTWDYGGTNQAMSAVTGFAGAQTSPLTLGITAWGLVAPTSGLKALRITFTGAPILVWICVEEWTGVDQTTPYRTVPSAVNNGAGDTTPSVTVAASQAGDTVVDAMTYYEGPSSTTQTIIREQENSGYSFGASYATAAGANHVMSWTISTGYSIANAMALVNSAGAAATSFVIPTHNQIKSILSR